MLPSYYCLDSDRSGQHPSKGNMSSSTVIQSCLDILRRTNPDDAEEIFSCLTKLVTPEVARELHRCISVPLKVCAGGCEKTILGCPQTNISGNKAISHRLVKLQSQFNDLFSIYRELYYGKSSLSSVHLWDTDSTGFAGCFLLYNTTKDDDAGNGDNNDDVSRWSSIHIVEASKCKDKWLYSLESTIYISIPRVPDTTISGSLTKRRQRKVSITGNDEVHISNIGKFIEDMENEMRSEIEGLYIQKTSLDYVMDCGGGTKGKEQEMSELMKDLNEAVLSRGLDGRLKLS
eukprot:CCRYP_020299-RA/>CCRYP_020299-RA protein AED:0.21 eAED:0.21 QI:37/1/1/1/1/1/3/172/288